MRTTVGTRRARARLDERPRPAKAATSLVSVAWIAAVVWVGPAAGQTDGPVVDSLRANTTASRIATSGGRADVNVGAYYTDNARRVEQGTVGDTVASAGLTIDHAHKGTHLEYSVNGDVNYLKYTGNTYKPETFGTLDASAQIELVADRIEWVFRDNFNRLQLDPTQAATPSNLLTYNYYTTGPQFRLRFGSPLQLILQAQYSGLNQVNSSNTVATTPVAVNLNSKRYGGTASLLYSVSERGRLSLNLRSEHIRYDDRTLNSDYTRGEASVGYDMQIARTTLGAEIGASRIKRQGQSANGVLARLGATRRTSPWSHLTVSLTRQTADAADLIRYDFGAIGPNATPLRVASNNPVVETTATAGWAFEKTRTRFGADLYWLQERYTFKTGLDRDVTGTHGYFERRMTPRLGVELSGHYERQTFLGNSLADTELTASGALNWYLGPHLKLTLRGDRFHRHGLTTLTFTENRIGLRLEYNLLRHRR